jgi:hypothetical protein
MDTILNAASGSYTPKALRFRPGFDETDELRKIHDV